LRGVAGLVVILKKRKAVYNRRIRVPDFVVEYVTDHYAKTSSLKDRNGVCSPTVRIPASQAGGLGSIPGNRMLCSSSDDQ
jgi:hypothetical protein